MKPREYPTKGLPECAFETSVSTILVDTQLKQWKGRIWNLAVLTATKCIDSMYDVDEITDRLRIALWLALEKYDDTRGMQLSTWIFGQLKQAAGLIIEEQYHSRDGVDSIIEIDRVTENDDDSFVTEIELKGAWEAIEDAVSTSDEISLTKAVRCAMVTDFEKRVFDELMSGDYDYDSHLAHELEVDFAKVAEVRLKMKLTLCLLKAIPFRKVTQAKGIERILRTIVEAYGYDDEDWEEKVVPLLTA